MSAEYIPRLFDITEDEPRGEKEKERETVFGEEKTVDLLSSSKISLSNDTFEGSDISVWTDTGKGNESVVRVRESVREELAKWIINAAKHHEFWFEKSVQKDWTKSINQNVEEMTERKATLMLDRGKFKEFVRKYEKIIDRHDSYDVMGDFNRAKELCSNAEKTRRDCISREMMASTRRMQDVAPKTYYNRRMQTREANRPIPPDESTRQLTMGERNHNLPSPIQMGNGNKIEQNHVELVDKLAKIFESGHKESIKKQEEIAKTTIENNRKLLQDEIARERTENNRRFLENERKVQGKILEVIRQKENENNSRRGETRPKTYWTRNDWVKERRASRKNSDSESEDEEVEDASEEEDDLFDRKGMPRSKWFGVLPKPWNISAPGKDKKSQDMMRMIAQQNFTKFSGKEKDYLHWRSAFIISAHDVYSSEQAKILAMKTALDASNIELSALVDDVLFATDGYRNTIRALEKRFGDETSLMFRQREKITCKETLIADDISSTNARFHSLKGFQTMMKNMDLDNQLNDKQLLRDIQRSMPKKYREQYTHHISGREVEPSFNNIVEWFSHKTTELQLRADCGDCTMNTKQVKSYLTQGDASESEEDEKFAAFSSNFQSRDKQVGSSRNKSEKSCDLCEENHLLVQCEKYQKMSPQERRNFVDKAKRCFICLKKGHGRKDCKSRYQRCKDCRQNHHNSLHGSKRAHLGNSSRMYVTTREMEFYEENSDVIYSEEENENVADSNINIQGEKIHPVFDRGNDLQTTCL